MTLHEAIYQTLLEEDRPMTSKEVAEFINSRNQYSKEDGTQVSPRQVTARISQFPQKFDYIQGEIILTQNSSWSDILRSHNYLQSLLGNVVRGDKGTLVVFLLFYKRISDLSDFNSEYNLPSQGRINYLRKNNSYSQAQGYINDFGVGIKYLENEFPQLRDFYYQQFDLLRSLDERVIFEILNSLSHFETSNLEDRKFGRIYEYLVQKSLIASMGSYYFTPQPVAELFGYLVDTTGVTKVYDPCAGLGGLLTEINKQTSGYYNIHYFASDLNSKVSALGTLNLILNGIRNFYYQNTDCLSNPFGLKFDLIVSDLPLISSISDSVDFSFIHKLGIPEPPRKGGTAAMILYVLSKLTDGGKAFLTVPDGFLSKKGFDQVTRKFIVDKGLLDGVISLPLNALSPYASAKISILCLSSHSKGQVKFINGATSLATSDEIGTILNYEKILEDFKWSNTDTRFSTIIPNSVISTNEYLLSVEQYNEVYREASTLLEEGNAKRLDSLFSIQSGSVFKNTFDQSEDEVMVLLSDSQIEIIKAENLKKDILDIEIGMDDIMNIIPWDNKVQRSILTEKCLLIARIGNNSKPTIFNPQDFDGPVAIHRSVYALIPRLESQMSVEYLYYQFYSPFVQQQLTNYQIGATIPHQSINNLKKLIIPVVDSGEQKRLVATQRANLIQLEKEKIDKRLKMLGYEKDVAEKESDIVRVLVHQLRPTFFSLNSQVEVIMRIVEKNKLEQFSEFNDDAPDFNDPELLAMGIAPNTPENYTLQEICEKLLKDSKDISDKLTYVNKVMSFCLDHEDFQEAQIKNFILNHIKIFQVNSPVKFKIEIGGDECSVEFNKESIGELIDQLINNAQAHAFNEFNRNNLLKINIKKNKKTPIVIIEYSNNGKDFKLTFEQFVSPFQKSQSSNGSGIGGYYIKRIIEAHGGTLRLNERFKNGFALTIELPITQKSNYDE